ncbi:hypothetical protein Tco_0490185 [Tanacetum coccineum]
MSRAMLRKACDPNYVPEPIYPEYIPLEDERKRIHRSTWIDRLRMSPVDYLMVGRDDGDDDYGDSSGDDIEEDEDEDDDDDEEEEEHLAPADFAIVVPVGEPVFPPEGT